MWATLSNARAESLEEHAGDIAQSLDSLSTTAPSVEAQHVSQKRHGEGSSITLSRLDALCEESMPEDTGRDSGEQPELQQAPSTQQVLQSLRIDSQAAPQGGETLRTWAEDPRVYSNIPSTELRAATFADVGVSQQLKWCAGTYLCRLQVFTAAVAESHTRVVQVRALDRRATGAPRDKHPHLCALRLRFPRGICRDIAWPDAACAASGGGRVPLPRPARNPGAGAAGARKCRPRRAACATDRRRLPSLLVGCVHIPSPCPLPGPWPVRQRLCATERCTAAGVFEPTALNPTAADIERSYYEGRRLAHLCRVLDKETAMAQLQAENPKVFAHIKDVLAETDPILDRGAWHAMWSSGFTPLGVYDTLLHEALAAQRAVEFIDPPQDLMAEFYWCAPRPAASSHRVLASTRCSLLGALALSLGATFKARGGMCAAASENTQSRPCTGHCLRTKEKMRRAKLMKTKARQWMKS